MPDKISGIQGYSALENICNHYLSYLFSTPQRFCQPGIAGARHLQYMVAEQVLFIRQTPDQLVKGERQGTAMRKTLLNRIRRILRNRRLRRMMTRVISIVAALVVFVTTYALVLPAITMEREADCGIEAHQHDDSCYERQLVCDIPEDPGHRHDDACYRAESVLKCVTAEHTHGEACYDEEGNLLCEQAEHTHDAPCYEEERELICGLEESAGHQHDDSCYENVLVCGKEVHVHSEDCYHQDPVEEEEIYSAEDEVPEEDMYHEEYAVPEEEQNQYVDEPADEPDEDPAQTPADAETYGPGGSSGTEGDAGAAQQDGEGASGRTGNEPVQEGGAEVYIPEVEAEPEVPLAAPLVPELEPLDFRTLLNSHTGIYYYHVQPGEVVENSAQITGWKKVTADTELGENDLLRVYLAYTLPAGAVNTTNAVVRYRLPGNLHLTDDQVKAINGTENGIAAQYVDYGTLTLTDPDNYHKYLGAEAVEGSRTPDQDEEAYLAAGGADGNGQEYISAVVRVENIGDANSGGRTGQDLLFTFVPYTVFKNRHEYDGSGQQTRTGVKVRGWFSLDFNMGQVDFDEVNVDGDREIRTADVVFAEEDEGLQIEEISTGLRLVRAADSGTEENPEAADPDRMPEEGLEDPAEQAAEAEGAGSADPAEDGNAPGGEAAEENAAADGDKDPENAENGEKLIKLFDESEEDSKKNSDKEDPDKKDPDKKDADENSEKDALAEIMPAMSFEDTIRVSTGRPAGAETKGSGGTVADAADALPKKANVTVRVEADEGTFPAGTTMVLAAVKDLDAVAETVQETVENGGPESGADRTDSHGATADAASGQAGKAAGSGKDGTGAPSGNTGLRTYGFQAVDISFRDADGNEIEPAKPVRVAMTSEIVEQVRREQTEDPATAVADPVVVHIDDNGNVETMDLIAPEEIEPAQGRTEEELREEAEAEAAARKEEKEKEAEAADQAEKKAGGETEAEKTEAADKDVTDAVDKEAAGKEERKEGTASEQAGNTEAPAASGSEDTEAGEAEPADRPETIEDKEEQETDRKADPAEGQGEAPVDTEPANPGTSRNVPSALQTVAFNTESFSVYVIVYTVDFEYSVNGEVYQFSLPGGGFVSFTDLVEVLGITHDTNSEENGDETGSVSAENAEENAANEGIEEDGINSDTNTPLTLGDVEVSEATRKFVADVTSVEFSSPELVDVSKVDADTTVGQLKENRELECQYSEDLTEEQIEEINAQTVDAGDWALISMQLFTSEETLTVTMKDGEVFTVKVTDAQISTHVITSDGKDFIITVTYGNDAQIPDGAKLEAEEIDPESSAYLEYINRTKIALAARTVEKATENEEVFEAATDDTEGNSDADNMKTDENNIDFARFFDIRIMKDGNTIEPKAAVKVSVTYANAVEMEEGDELLAVHFGEQGTELIDTSIDQEMKEIVFTQGSFSVTGTVVSTNANSWPSATGSYVLYTQIGGNYYAIKHDRNLVPVTVNNGKVVFAEDVNINEYMWEYEQGTAWVNWQQVTNNRISYTEGGTKYYLNPAAETGINASNRALARNNSKIRTDGSGTVYYITNNDLQISGYGNFTNGIPIYFSTFPRTVTLHFVDEAGRPLEGFTYNGETIEGSTYIVTPDWAQEQGTINLENFIKSGYTLSNTHKSTWMDLEGSYSGYQSYTGNSGKYPHTIIGNELKWNDGTLQYRLFYANSDKAGSHWFDVGLEPERNDNHWKYDWGDHSGGNPTNYSTTTDDAANPYDYYLVYSQNPSGSGSGGIGGELGDIPEIGHTKEKTSNYDGTYNLELGVSSEAVEKEADQKINVIMVIDTSSSMRRRFDSETDNSGGNNFTANNDPNSRIYNTREAVSSFVTELMRRNGVDPDVPDAVEMELITFNMGAHVYQDWSTSGTTLNGKVLNLYTELDSGTNWAEALNLARTQALAKNDGDPTYVLFLTDGAPSQYWNSSEQTGYYVSGEGCYLGARDEARAAARDGVNLYTIFSYGTSTDQSNDYLGKLTDYAYNSDSAKDSYRYYAGSGDELKNQLEAILTTMEKHFGAGDVQINDGITELTTVTFEHVEPESFQYTIKYKDYTDPENENVFTEHTLTHGNGITVAGTGNNQTITIPSVTYHTWQNGVYKEVTTDQVTIKGAVFSDTTPESEKSVTWKLEKTDGSTYILEDNWTYNVKFKIWPSQDSYDLLAALNNGFLTWGQDFVNGDHTIPASEYTAQIDNTVSPYALKTNTTANVTYKKTTSTTVNDETTYASGDTITVDLPTVDGMPLDNTMITLEKKWNSTLSDEDQPEAVDLYVLIDPTPEKIAAFNTAYAAYAAAIEAAGDNAEAIAAAEEAFKPYYYYKAALNADGSWKHALSIAPGVYDQYGHMNTTGHTYMVMEPAIDGHYELEATPTHPMLNGLTHDETDPNTIKDMVDVYGYDLTSLDVNDPNSYPPTYEQDAQHSSVYSVANTLKAGINIRKELVDIPDGIKNTLYKDKYFQVKVTLVGANHAPVYDTTDGGGAVGYRIFAPADKIPAEATVIPAGASGDAVTSYTINGVTYVRNGENETPGFTARGLIGTDGTVTLMIRECDVLRIVNVPMGTTYTVEEVDIPAEFKYKEMYWEVIKNNQIFENKEDTVTDVSITETIVPDAENNVVIRNNLKTGNINLAKAVTINGFLPDSPNVSAADRTKADGIYTFHLSGKEGTAVSWVSHTVMITIKNGAMFSATIDGSAAQIQEGHVVLQGLPMGEYIVTEDEDTNAETVCSAISCTTDNAAVISLETLTAEVPIESGDNDSLQFTNNYSNSTGDDIAHVSVRKTFIGLDLSQIPSDFSIPVTVNATIDGHAETFEYTLTNAENQPDGVSFTNTVSEGTVVWNWRIAIPGLKPDATVTISETGQAVEGYEVTSTLNGANQTSSTGTVSAATVVQDMQVSVITANNRKTFPLYDDGDTAQVFMARLTNEQTSIVISKNRLTLSEKQKIEQLLRTSMSSGGDWTHGHVVRYYNFEEAAGNQIIVKGKTVTFDEEARTITFNQKCQWTMTGTGTITYQPGRPADFNFVNNYSEIPITIEVEKVDKNNNNVKLPGAVFTLRQLADIPPTENGTLTTLDGTTSSDSAPTDSEGKTSFGNLTHGYYEVTEKTAPSGYVMTDEITFYFKVDNGEVIWLVKGNDKPSTWTEKTRESGDMVSFEEAHAAVAADPEHDIAAAPATNAVFTVENTPGVALPSTGGPGTRIFSIFGSIMILGAGVLLWRRRRTI